VEKKNNEVLAPCQKANTGLDKEGGGEKARVSEEERNRAGSRSELETGLGPWGRRV